MSKKDFRLYCEEEYIEHLKAIADEKGTSVNQLVLSVLTKKYPMPKKKERTVVRSFRVWDYNELSSRFFKRSRSATRC